MKPPIFIGGAGRSGTTLLRVILDTHPAIACGPEFKMIPAIAEQWRNIYKGQLKNVLNAYELRSEDINEAFRNFIYALLSKYLLKSGKQRIAEKSPNNVFYFFELNQIFPNSPLIHVIRDGRDVICSLLTMNWIDPATKRKVPYVETAESAAKYWLNSIKSGRTAAQNDSVKNNYIEVKYEDIVMNPEITLKKIFDFIGEAWDPCVLNYHLKKRNLAGESSANQVSQKLYTQSRERWKNDLTGKDKETVKENIGELLIELGYAENKEW